MQVNRVFVLPASVQFAERKKKEMITKMVADLAKHHMEHCAPYRNIMKALPTNLNDSTMIHSGGWKKLQEEAVVNDRFKEMIEEQSRIKRIFNFYGLVNISRFMVA